MMLVCDLDDTLYREVDYVLSGYHAIGRELQRRGLMNEANVVDQLRSSATTAEGLDRIAAELWIKHPESKVSAKELVEIYRHHIPAIHLAAGVRPTFEELRQRGVEIGIITDGRTFAQKEKIKALGLLEFVSPSNIIISQEIGADKTERKPFELLAARNPGESVFVYLGDNPAKDFHWPNEMGWLTVMLTDHTATNIHSQQIEVAPNYRAQYTIGRFPEILQYFGEKNQAD